MATTTRRFDYQRRSISDGCTLPNPLRKDITASAGVAIGPGYYQPVSAGFDRFMRARTPAYLAGRPAIGSVRHSSTVQRLQPYEPGGASFGSPFLRTGRDTDIPFPAPGPASYQPDQTGRPPPKHNFVAVQSATSRSRVNDVFASARPRAAPCGQEPLMCIRCAARRRPSPIHHNRSTDPIASPCASPSQPSTQTRTQTRTQTHTQTHAQLQYIVPAHDHDPSTHPRTTRSPCQCSPSDHHTSFAQPWSDTGSTRPRSRTHAGPATHLDA